MIEISKFFHQLKISLEEHSGDLKRGDVFLPQHLSGRQCTNRLGPVAHTLAHKLGLRVRPEVPNRFLPEYKIGGSQRIDFVFRETGSDARPVFFLEVESLDGTQLYHFFEHTKITEENNCNKLWYYYGTLGNHYSGTAIRAAPRYFVWLLILPDRQIDLSPYQWWDSRPGYGFFHPSLKLLVCQNPYRFYDHLIKSAARLFIEDKKRWGFRVRGTKTWITKDLDECQKVCELIFITCTINELILSRSTDKFSPAREVHKKLVW